MAAHPEAVGPETNGYYEDNYSYLAAELEKLDGLLRLRVATLRQEWQARPESTGHHLYISHEEVDWLLRGLAEETNAEQAELHQTVVTLQREIDEKTKASLERGVFLGLPQLARLFSLSAFEVQAVLICAAPELRRVYDRVYAYLQDDITRKRASVDLILDLLCDSETERWKARAVFDGGAPLLTARILEPVDDPHSPSGSSGLARFLKLDTRILHFILGHRTIDSRLKEAAQLRRLWPACERPAIDRSIVDPLLSFVRHNFADEAAPNRRLLLHLRGPSGVGKRQLALAVSEAFERPLLSLGVERLPERQDEAEELLWLALRESVLAQAPLYIAPADVFLRDETRAVALRKALAQAVSTFGWLVILGGANAWPIHEPLEDVLFHSIELPIPDGAIRETAWIEALGTTPLELRSDDAVARLAERFRLAGGQIRDAVAAVANQRLITDSKAPVSFAELAAACRAQSGHGLDKLATKVEPRSGWVDLILPDENQSQLEEICDQVRHRFHVYDRWGFGRKLSRGRGISALFSGPPGTGKTMAAEIIAGDLQLDLYKIDLARVVSKYIGETEKNLSRVFDEAEGSNAVLFFDEADALFGKRTEISDAHDRYANVETSYLLQKMEEFDGVVILASNLRENIDDAFLRRIRFIVEFPFPDAASRLRIWTAHFPPEAPVAEGVDFELLAERVRVTGGNIRNIVLNSAFFAAADGGVIGTEHILQATRREFEKIGQLWDERSLAGKPR